MAHILASVICSTNAYSLETRMYDSRTHSTAAKAHTANTRLNRELALKELTATARLWCTEAFEPG